MRSLRWISRVGAAGTAAVIGLVATGAILSPASADAPTKVGWWTTASGGGQAAPAPGAPAGGIRLEVTSSQVLAFGAVEYALPADGSGTLTLNIAQMSGASQQMLNGIEACPTSDDSWKPGDDQPSSDQPKYDCSTHHFVGNMSSDGKSISFNVDGSVDVTPGNISLAIVPTPTTGLPAVGTDTGTGVDTNPPFVIDFAKPDSSSFTVDGGSSASSSDSSTVSPASGMPPAASSTGASGAAPAIPAGGGDVSIPAATTTDTGQTPVVATAPQSTTAGQTFQPIAAAKTTGPSQDRRDLLFVLLILLLFGFLYTQNATARAPRMIGPRARSGDGDAAATAAALPMPYPVGTQPRGLGRFAKHRTEPARPLI